MGSCYTILEHTADTGFRAWGATREEAFENAAAALVSVALDAGAAVAAEEVALRATGPDEGELLVSFLSEVLYLVDGARFVPASVRVTSLEEGSVEAVARGEPRDDSRHAPRIVVKAVTYHQLFFGRRGGRWEAEVFLDI